MIQSQPQQGPGPWPVALLAGALLADPLLALGTAASAQTLLDISGASAIQGSLNSTAAPQYGSTLQRVKASLGKVPNPGSSSTGSSTFAPAMGPPAGGDSRERQPGPGAYVNGHAVALCSHGGLCLGQLRQALRHP